MSPPASRSRLGTPRVHYRRDRLDQRAGQGAGHDGRAARHARDCRRAIGGARAAGAPLDRAGGPGAAVLGGDPGPLAAASARLRGRRGRGGRRRLLASSGPTTCWSAVARLRGILVEARPQEGWAVAGIGLNVALRERDFPPELAASAGTLGLELDAIEDRRSSGCWTRSAAGPWPRRTRCSRRSARAMRCSAPDVRWAEGQGRGAGIDGDGRLLVETGDGARGARRRRGSSAASGRALAWPDG